MLDHLTDEQKPGVAKRLNAAYALEDYTAAKQELNQFHRELMDLNPSAARNFGEGGRDLDRASTSRPDATAKDAVEHQRDRVRVFNRGAGLQKREMLARLRPAGDGCGQDSSLLKNSSAASQGINRSQRPSENWKHWRRPRKGVIKARKAS